MASLDFDQEKILFRDYYNDNHDSLDRAKDSYISLVKSILAGEDFSSQVVGRVKDREECIGKFARKYQTVLEEKDEEYEIKDYITDLIGIRIICLYEKNVNEIKEVLSNEFEVIEITNKTEKIEKSESSFGYKGLHLDLKLSQPRTDMPEYKGYKDFRFELQVRTIIQDAWSVLDHKIKYKKSIPHNLKRRINVLAALFELADREFFNIREETILLKDAAEAQSSLSNNEPLDVFSFLRIIENKFLGYEFMPYKVDGFVEEINNYGQMSAQDFAQVIEENFQTIDEYNDYLSQRDMVMHALNPYTTIRHILYVSDRDKYERILYNTQRKTTDKWLNEHKTEKG